MTFVAQNYERFADDLLTALTGGMIREEHRFSGIDESYSLASRRHRPNSQGLRQRNDLFALFEGGIDYDYKTEEESLSGRREAGCRMTTVIFT